MIIVPLSVDEINKIVTDHLVKKYKGKVSKIEPKLGIVHEDRDSDPIRRDYVSVPKFYGLEITILD